MEDLTPQENCVQMKAKKQSIVTSSDTILSQQSQQNPQEQPLRIL